MLEKFKQCIVQSSKLKSQYLFPAELILGNRLGTFWNISIYCTQYSTDVKISHQLGLTNCSGAIYLNKMSPISFGKDKAMVTGQFRSELFLSKTLPACL